MTLTIILNPKTELMYLRDRINSCGMKARKQLERACKKAGVDYWRWFDDGQVEQYLAVCKKVEARWFTTKKFKVGDKVYVDTGSRDFIFTHYIRATVTDIDEGKWGYHLKAFKQDLPGIFLFNIWDKDLLPRVGRANKLLPRE